MMTIKAKILVRTEKAALLQIVVDEYLQLKGYKGWFPLSELKIRELKRSPGLYSITMPNWLYDDHVVIDPKTL